MAFLGIPEGKQRVNDCTVREVRVCIGHCANQKCHYNSGLVFISLLPMYLTKQLDCTIV